MKKYMFNEGNEFKKFLEKHVETNRKSTEPELSGMSLVRKYLLMKNVSFKEKFRKFPINDGGSYVPKLILNDVSYGTKHVVIDICENPPTDKNTSKLRLFIDKYWSHYSVILIVHDRDLREWNKWNSERHTFDDIWTSDSIEILANYLQSMTKHNSGKYVQKEFARCDQPNGCGKTISGHDEIETVFGYQKNNDGKILAHSYCKKCRRKMNRDEPDETPDDWEAKNTYCTGCRSTFVPTSPSQSHCKSCLQEFGL